MKRHLLTYGLLALFIALPARAQVQYWDEIPVPHDTVNVQTATFMPTIVVRYGQQGILLLPPPGASYTFLSVTVNGTSTGLYAGSVRSDGFLWTTYPSETEPMTVDVNFGASGFTFKLITVPPAVRAFSDNVYVDAVVGMNGVTPITKRRRGKLLLWSSGTTSATMMDKPLLMVEGIDADQSNAPEDYFALGAGLLNNAIQQEGADVLIMDFPDGGRDMAVNADVVVGALNLVRRLKSDPDRGVDVVAVSMGGVVARYALAKLEQNLYTHDVLRFVSLDAPQQGAVFDNVLQDNLKASHTSHGTDIPLTLVRDAAKQLLKYNAFDQTGTTHSSFYNNLRALNGGYGYPRSAENVGVSFGTASTNPNAGSNWLTINAPFFMNDYFYVQGAIAEGGSFLPLDATQVAGAIELPIGFIRLRLPYSLQRNTDPTFIPYTSALDLTNNVSRFDGTTISPPAPSAHDRVPQAIFDPLLHRLGYFVPAPTWATVSGPDALALNEIGRWEVNTSNGSGVGHALHWRYRIYYSFCGGVGAFARSESSGGKGGIEPNLVSCGEWQDGGVTGRFVFASSNAAQLDIQAYVKDDEGSVWSSIKSVQIGSGGGMLSRSTSEAGLEGAVPASFAFSGVSPSPLRSGEAMHLRFDLSEAAEVTATLYDVLGREVGRTALGYLSAGRHALPWMARSLGSGTYVVRIEAGEHMATRMLVVL